MDLFLETVSLVGPSIKVATVDHGEKLMKHLTELPYRDCIFLDLNLPKRTGRSA